MPCNRNASDEQGESGGSVVCAGGVVGGDWVVHVNIDAIVVQERNVFPLYPL